MKNNYKDLLKRAINLIQNNPNIFEITDIIKFYYLSKEKDMSYHVIAKYIGLEYILRSKYNAALELDWKDFDKRDESILKSTLWYYTSQIFISENNLTDFNNLFKF